MSHTVTDNIWIPINGNRRLAARLWMPDLATQNPVPAVLEYLPYRKRDGTAPRDESTYPGFANAGIAGVRVDIAGCGESDGLFDDEYSEQELADGESVIAWIAAQEWCNGSVGVMGISWGGFNALQLAQRKPPALKAVISLSSTVDRYHDDIHYKQGCLLYSNFYWANMMLCYTSRPPDPQLRDDWLVVWQQRLQNIPWLLPTWLTHQRRNQYWQHGSIIDDIDQYDTPTLIIGGWADLYVNAPPALLQGSNGPSKAVIGPWIHKYPHFAWPKPRMDFIAEAVRWWQHWLNENDNNVAEWPDYRAYINQNSRPSLRRDHEHGHWVQLSGDGSSIEWQHCHPDSSGQLIEPRNGNSAVDAHTASLSICSPLNCGTACGEVFTLSPDAEMPTDQRADDAGSLTFDSAVLQDPLTILGRPIFHCLVEIDKPQGNLIARLVDIHPDGTGHRVSWGCLNLAHRNGSEHPQAMQAGKPEWITLTLNECGYRFLPGHKYRLSLSTNYWPTVQPPPEIVTATIHLQPETRLSLPHLSVDTPYDMAEPDNPDPLPQYTAHLPAHNGRRVEHDLQHGMTHYRVSTESGESEIPAHGLRTRHLREECWSIQHDDPLSARAEGEHTWWSSRDNWHIKTRSSTTMSCNATHFHMTARLEAWHDDELVGDHQWQRSIARDHI